MILKIVIGLTILICVNNLFAQKFKIEINKNIETLSIIYTLTDQCSEYYTDDYKQIKEIQKVFQSFKNHEVVRQTNHYIENGFLEQGKLMDLCVNYEDVPNCKLKKGTYLKSSYLETDTSMHIENANKEFDKYMNLVNKFYIDSKLEQYFKSHEQVLKYAETELSKLASKHEYVNILETFFGTHQFNFRIIPSIHVPPYMNFATSTIIPTGKEIYFIMGIVHQDFDFNNYIKYKNLYNSYDYFAGLFLHEFSHSFVGEIIEDSTNIIKILSTSFLTSEKMKEKLIKQGYGINWNTYFEEYLVRSIELFLFNEIGFTKEYEEQKNNYFKNGYIYIDEFINSIKDYSQNRNKYKKFGDYFDTLIINLHKIKPREIMGN